MAGVDGSRSTDKQMHRVINAQCGQCAGSGLVKEASMYCEQCDECMCVECASIHNDINGVRHHTTVSKGRVLLGGQSGTNKPSLSYCAKHGDKEIDWFCGKHEAMFCNTCKIIEHRKCKVVSVSDQKTSEYGHSLDDVIGSLESLKSRIENLKSARVNSVDDLANFQKSCEYTVQQFKSTIIEKVERMEKEILADVDKVVTTETAVVQDHINTCDSLIHEVELELTTADEAQTAADDVTSVIAAHKLSKTVKTVEHTVSDLEQEIYNVQIKFKPSVKLPDVFTGTDQLGILEVDRTETVGVDPTEAASDGVPTVSARTSWSDMQVVSSTEINVSSTDVTGSAVMPDGRLILADYSNKQIILLGEDFNKQSMLTLSGAPCGVAVYDDNAVIVTIPGMKQLRHIHVDTTLRAGHTIPIKQLCISVAVHGGETYVGVSGGQYGDHVQVMDTRGNVTRRIGVDVHGTGRRSVYPECITVGTGGTLYISGRDHIRCYTNAGDVVYYVQHEGMSVPRGMLADEKDNLLVCCVKSNTIHVLGKDGAHHKVILSSSEGLVHPQSVSYRRSDQTLIVTMQNKPSCRAYKLK